MAPSRLPRIHRSILHGGRLLALGVLLFGGPNETHAQPTPARAVLVTGARTGIGRTITERLASRGWFVYGGARRAEDIAALSRIPNVQGAASR